jgi:hypothetical protein
VQVAPQESYRNVRPLNELPSMAEASDIGVPVSGSDRRAPFVSILEDAEVNLSRTFLLPNNLQWTD